MKIKSFWRWVSSLPILLATSFAFADLPLIPGLLSWPMQGGSELNQSQSFAPLINKYTINSLKQINLGGLAGLTIGSASATPSVVPTILKGKPILMMYASDANGNLFGFDVTNNKLIWSKNYNDYSSNAKLGGKKIYLNYITPTVVNNMILVGNNYPGAFTPDSYAAQDGAILMAVNRYTGALIWASQLDNHPTAIITASPVVHNGIAYVGISTYESGTPGILSGSIPEKNYTCCTFRGNVVAVNVSDGSIKWRQYLMPTSLAEQDYTKRPTGDNSFSGSAVWGGQVAFDAKRNQVIVTTGQTHTLPKSYSIHAIPAGTANDAIVALDASTGKINWIHNFGIVPNPGDQLNPLRPDIWNESCISPLLPFVFPGITPDPNAVKEFCRSDLTYPAGEYAVSTGSMYAGINLFIAYLQGQATVTDLVTGLLAFQYDPNGTDSSDRDFPQGAMVLYNVKMPDGSRKDLIVAMQKSSIVHAVDPSTGATVWDSPPLGGGPGGSANSRSSAYDGKYIYAKDLNEGVVPLTVKDINGNVSTTTGSVLAAIDPATGHIVWSIGLPKSPNPGAAFIPGAPATFDRTSFSAITAVNGMVIFGDDLADKNPLYQFFGIFPKDTVTNLYAYDGKTGQLLKTFTTSLPVGSKLAPAVVGNSIYWVTGIYHPEKTSEATPGQIIKLCLPLPDGLGGC